MKKGPLLKAKTRIDVSYFQSLIALLHQNCSQLDHLENVMHHQRLSQETLQAFKELKENYTMLQGEIAKLRPLAYLPTDKKKTKPQKINLTQKIEQIRHVLTRHAKKHGVRVDVLQNFHQNVSIYKVPRNSFLILDEYVKHAINCGSDHIVIEFNFSPERENLVEIVITDDRHRDDQQKCELHAIPRSGKNITDAFFNFCEEANFNRDGEEFICIYSIDCEPDVRGDDLAASA
jgi:hypothetical protein